ncbi:MAG: AAA family ATPase, partial [Isosphaeraceae bacterium]
IPASRVVGVAASEGTGKTRFLLDLARILYLGLPWPDGQPATLPAGTRTLWLCADGHQDEIAETLPGFGLPDDAVVFPAHPDEPYDGTSLDDGELVGEGGILEEAIREVRPGLVVVDTLTNATARDLCAQAQMKSLKDPLVRLVQRHGINIVLSLHLNKEGQALGRRVRGITRTLIHLECPDPARSGRLRLWVEKSYGMKPPALGVTMGEHGNTYDDAPPPRAEPGEATPSGRPPERRGKAVEFLREALGRENDQLGNDLCRAWVAEGGGARTFWRAVDQLEEAGELVSDGGPGTRKPKVLHLIVTE